MLQEITINDQSYICPNWSEMGALTVELAQKVQNSSEKFDRVVALAKGGLSWNRQLQDLLNIKNTSSIQVRFYQGIKDTTKRPIVIQSLPVSIENESILIFDDVADTGESLGLAVEYLNHHGAKNIKTATVFEKPWSKFKPNFSAFKTEGWIIFPHDSIENMNLLKDKWNSDIEELKSNYQKIGIEESIINFYLASFDRS